MEQKESKELATQSTVSKEIQEKVLLGGDLSSLTAEQRLSYYNSVCQSLGLNPLTKPFGYITLNNKLTLYALKDCTEQLRAVNKVSIVSLEKSKIEDVFIVTASAKRADGRTDASTGAVNVSGLKGNDLANAMMKAETKAKRRVTLSICGLGMLDEAEVETIKDARVHNDTATVTVTEVKPAMTQAIINQVLTPKAEATPAPSQTKTVEAEVVDKKTGEVKSEPSNNDKSQKMMKAIHVMLKTCKIETEPFHFWAHKIYGVKSMAEMTEEQLIEVGKMLRTFETGVKDKNGIAIKELNDFTQMIVERYAMSKGGTNGK